MTPQANQMDGTIANNFNSLGLSRTTVKECTQSHGWEFREQLLGPIVAYSSDQQGRFFIDAATTSSCDQIEANHKVWRPKSMNGDSFYFDRARLMADQNN